MKDKVKKSAGLSVILLLCVSGFLLISCATKPEAYREVDVSVFEGNFDAGVAAINKAQEAKRPLYSEKDAIMLYLDRGMLQHYAGNNAESVEELQKAEMLIEDAFTKSVTQEVGSYMVNDNTRDYPGEDYEDIYVSAFNALNFYHQGKMESAMVEIRRMTDKLKFLATKYDVELSELQKKSLEDGASELPQDDAHGLSSFSDSAFARYLGMLFYRGTGQPDSARVDRDWLLAAMANAPAVYTNPVPKSISEELEIPREMARLNVVAFSGLSPLKEEEVIRFALPAGNTNVKISVPIMIRRPSEIGSVKVVFNHGDTVELELLEDMEAVAIETFRSRQNLIYTKAVIRAMVKAVAAAAMDVASDNVGGTAGTVLAIASIGTKVFAEVSEQADIRISRYFPGRVYVGGVNVTPGTHSFTIFYYNQAGREVTSFHHEMDVKENALNLVEAVCLR